MQIKSSALQETASFWRKREFKWSRPCLAGKGAHWLVRTPQTNICDSHKDLESWRISALIYLPFAKQEATNLCHLCHN